MEEKKPIEVFRAEDFFTGSPYDDTHTLKEMLLLPCVAKDLANARLAPLAEALEDWYQQLCADHKSRTIPEKLAAVLAEWEKLRG